jgi:hypothetical protein
VEARTLAVVMREHVSGLEPELLADLHDPPTSERREAVPLAEARRAMIQTNRDRLVETTVQGEATAPVFLPGIYEVTGEGVPFIVPSVGGITLNVRVGDGVADFVGDHLEPAVSVAHRDEKVNRALNILACVGNEAIVHSGEAKGERGRVTGKHGGIEHVMIDFPRSVMKKLAIGDTVVVRAIGLGLELAVETDIKIFNCAPDFLDAMDARWNDGKLEIAVAKRVPAAIMGSGLGRATVVRGDYDIQMFDEAIVEEYGLRDLRFGDLVAIENADHSFGRIYRGGAMTIGIVAHGASALAGHGPGVTTLLTSRSGAIAPYLDSKANIATILDLR